MQTQVLVPLILAKSIVYEGTDLSSHDSSNRPCGHPISDRLKGNREAKVGVPLGGLLLEAISHTWTFVSLSSDAFQKETAPVDSP